jgi:hypothetical protein
VPPRIRAALVHLSLSAAVALAVFLAIYFYWYPGVLFEGAGGKELFFLIAGVDVALGPLITLVIFKPGKWGLKFDLVCISIVQVAALAYGGWVMFEARPVYIAFVVDRFAIVRANGFPDEALEKAQSNGYGELSWTGPRWVGVKLPADADEQFKLATSAAGGVDAEYYPQFYVPYDSVRADVRMRAQPIDTLRKRNPQRLHEIDEAISATGRKEGAIAFIPMRAGKKDLSVFVDRATGDVLKITSLLPWGEL